MTTPADYRLGGQVARLPSWDGKPRQWASRHASRGGYHRTWSSRDTSNNWRRDNDHDARSGGNGGDEEDYDLPEEYEEEPEGLSAEAKPDRLELFLKLLRGFRILKAANFAEPEKRDVMSACLNNLAFDVVAKAMHSLFEDSEDKGRKAGKVKSGNRWRQGGGPSAYHTNPGRYSPDAGIGQSTIPGDDDNRERTAEELEVWELVLSAVAGKLEPNEQEPAQLDNSKSPAQDDPHYQSLKQAESDAYALHEISKRTLTQARDAVKKYNTERNFGKERPMSRTMFCTMSHSYSQGKGKGHGNGRSTMHAYSEWKADMSVPAVIAHKPNTARVARCVHGFPRDSKAFCS